MPRPMRIQDAGYVHHIVCRGNDRQDLFKSPNDFRKYLELLEIARKQFSIRIYNYALIDNHIHLLIEPLKDGALSKAMESISKGYAKYFNKTYDHMGHVFQGRFKSFLIQKERYFFACSRSIDMNAVQEGIVKSPKDYLWSGYSNLAHGEAGELKVDLNDLYENLGANASERQIAYRALVLNYQGEELNLLERRAGILGDAEFRKSFKKK